MRCLPFTEDLSMLRLLEGLEQRALEAGEVSTGVNN